MLRLPMIVSILFVFCFFKAVEYRFKIRLQRLGNFANNQNILRGVLQYKKSLPGTDAWQTFYALG